MYLNIQDLNTFWLTCEKTKDRWPKIQNLLSNLGVKNTTKVDEGITTPYTIGISRNHIVALTEGRQRGFPFLVIEDDVALNPNSNLDLSNFLMPECEALYLGTSTFGRIHGKTHIRGAVVCNHGEFFKPINMLGMHAIIYNSDRYVQHTINILENFINSNPKVHPDIGCDNPIAETMWKFDVKSVKVPVFYQNDGHTDGPTRAQLLPIC